MLFMWLDWISVFLYGVVLTLSFLKLKLTRKNIMAAVFLSLGCIAIQIVIVYLWGFGVVNKAYPFIVHIPLCVLCVYYYKKSVASSIFALLAVYMLTIPRNLLGLVPSILLPDIPYALDTYKTLITIPLLILLLRYWTPGTWGFLSQPDRILWIQMIPFALYYIIAYATTVYSQILYDTNILVISFIMTLFAIFIFMISSIVGIQNNRVLILQQKQNMLKLQSTETKLRLDETKRSQQQARIIRHDTRHYFQMIDSYAAAGDITSIRDYIRQLNTKIDETIVKQYCLNEQVNLVLSSYICKATDLGIKISIDADVPDKLNDDLSLDLCILLANAMENATTASAKTENPWITLNTGMVGDKLVIQISNCCKSDVVFENGLPKSNRIGHGFGSYSIITLAEKHGGTADFTYKDGVFTVRAVM